MNALAVLFILVACWNGGIEPTRPTQPAHQPPSTSDKQPPEGDVIVPVARAVKKPDPGVVNLTPRRLPSEVNDWLFERDRWSAMVDKQLPSPI